MPACVAEQTQWDDVDLHFMARAIRLANGAQGTTAPNPPVGCVIVRENVVIAEGATGPGGRPHAEANALSCINHEANGATAYVTLEPLHIRLHLAAVLKAKENREAKSAGCPKGTLALVHEP